MQFGGYRGGLSLVYSQESSHSTEITEMGSLLLKLVHHYNLH